MFSELTNPWWAFILLGIIAGIASGLLGIGGGVIMVPALVLILAAFDQKTAQGTALVVMIPMSIVGSLRYMQNPDISLNWTVVTLIVAGAVIGSIIGVALMSRLPVSFIRKCFGVLMLVLAVKMFISKPIVKATDIPKDPTQTILTEKD